MELVEVARFPHANTAVLSIDKIVPKTFCPPGYESREDVAPEQRVFIRKTDKLKVLITAVREQDGRAWLHVSFSFKNKMPAYKEMTHVKAVFIGANRVAYMVLPRSEDHYNFHPYCLHLFSPLEGEDPLPDFLASVGGI